MVAAKLTEWHAKLGEMRLTEMRTNRANDRSAYSPLSLMEDVGSPCYYGVLYTLLWTIYYGGLSVIESL